MEIFVAGINRIRSIKGLSQENLADKIPGGKRGTVSSWLRGRTKLPSDRMDDFSVALCVSMDEIMAAGREAKTFEENKKKEAKYNTDNKETNSDNVFKINDPIEAEHLSVIRKFKNKSLACSVNKKLVELESLDDTALAEIVVEINKKIKELKKEHEQQESTYLKNGTDPEGV
nr:helix-turn-helix transcriptional regulator [uncultured Desulfobacter sp.]